MISIFHPSSSFLSLGREKVLRLTYLASIHPTLAKEARQDALEELIQTGRDIELYRTISAALHAPHGGSLEAGSSNPERAEAWMERIKRENDEKERVLLQDLAIVTQNFITESIRVGFICVCPICQETGFLNIGRCSGWLPSTWRILLSDGPKGQGPCLFVRGKRILPTAPTCY